MLLSEQIAWVGAYTQEYWSGWVEQRPERGALALWLGMPSPDMLRPELRHWLVRRPNGPSVADACRLGFEAAFDEMELPVPGVGLVRFTMRPAAPGEPVTAVVYAQAAPLLSLRYSDTYTHNVGLSAAPMPAASLWAHLRAACAGRRGK
jgi:hypothetical protein